MIRACPHIRAMRLDGVQLHAGGRKERQHPGEGSGVGRAFPACKDFLLLVYNGGLGMFRWLHMTALASCPLTALPGFMVLNASGQHPEPLALSAAHRWGAIALWGLPADTRDSSTR